MPVLKSVVVVLSVWNLLGCSTCWAALVAACWVAVACVHVAGIRWDGGIGGLLVVGAAGAKVRLVSAH